jgi:hypothetical protein
LLGYPRNITPLDLHRRIRGPKTERVKLPKSAPRFAELHHGAGIRRRKDATALSPPLPADFAEIISPKLVRAN